MKNLQKIIDERARKRATEEVKKLTDAFSANNDLQGICSGFYVKIPNEHEEPDNDEDSMGPQKTNDLRSAFWSTGNTIPKLMIEQLAEVYIPEESKKFVEDVERLKTEIDDLHQFNHY